MSDRLDPACGSLRHMVPKKRPENSLRANTSRCSGEPCAISRLALPLVSIAPPPRPIAALEKKVLAAISITHGSCMPPIAWSWAAASMPDSA